MRLSNHALETGLGRRGRTEIVDGRTADALVAVSRWLDSNAARLDPGSVNAA